jgi:PAS domain S-box-containing protein
MEGKFKVDNACCADEAIKKMSIDNYDVVVSDYEMPQKNGLEFLKELREKNNKIPFILFIEKGREEVAIKALNLGADGYVNKQGNPETVYGELEHVIQQKVEHKKAELIVFEAAAYAQNIMATMRESLLVLDENLKVISANDSFYKTFEVTSKETEGNCIYDLGNSQWDIPILHELLEKINSDQSFFSDFEVEHVFPKIGRKIMLLNARQLLQRVKGANLILVAFEDITERKKAEEALRIVAENLKRSNLELEQFAYVASHDLQEPLRMVTSYTQLLEQRYKGKLDADADEFIKYAVDGANRMRRLIDDLLSYSRVNSRGNPFRPTESELALDVALKNLQISIEENGAVVTHDQLPEVMADEGQLVQLLQNLIGNAIKFHAKEPPCVHVSAKHLQEKEYLFSVQDNGIGIDPQYFDRLFKIFQRLHTKEEYPGTGIGLALCKRIVERHSGRIWLESQPGKGTTIYFTLNNKKGGNQEI